MGEFSKKIHKWLTDYEQDDFGVVVGTMQPYINGYQRVNVYNKNINSPLHKIWLRFPKVKLLSRFSIDNKPSYRVKIAIAPMSGKNKKIVQFIEKLEKMIGSEIVKEEQNVTMKPSIKKINNYMAIMDWKILKKDNKFGFNAFDNNNNQIDVLDIDNRSNVSCYLELSDVWISANEYGFNWTILQIKTYPVFDFTKCLFDDEEVDNEDEYVCNVCKNRNNISHNANTHSMQSMQSMQSMPPIPPRIPFRQQPALKNNDTQKNASIGAFMPSVSMLQNIKNGLKKVNNLNKNILPGKTMDSLLFEAELDNENLNRKLNRSNKAYTEMIESGI